MDVVQTPAPTWLYANYTESVAPTTTTVAPDPAPTTTTTLPSATTTVPAPVPPSAPPTPPSAPPTPPSAPSSSYTVYQGVTMPAWVANVFACIVYHESSGNWADDTGNGYYGAYQFDLTTWQSVGGTGLPSQASPYTQTLMAYKLWQQRGFEPWSTAPLCT